MTDVETVALREELARIMASADGYWILGDPMPALPPGVMRPPTMTLAAAVSMFDTMMSAILPIIARERAAALSAATPAIEARAREEMAKVAEEYQCSACGIWFHPSAGHYDEDCPKGRASWNGARESSAIAAAIRKG